MRENSKYIERIGRTLSGHWVKRRIGKSGGCSLGVKDGRYARCQVYDRSPVRRQRWFIYLGWCGIMAKSSVQTIYRNSLAAPLFSLVATATRASRRPIPEFRAGESGKTSDRGSRSLVAWKLSACEDCRPQIYDGISNQGDSRPFEQEFLPVQGDRRVVGSHWIRCIRCYAQSLDGTRAMQWKACGHPRCY